MKKLFVAFVAIIALFSLTARAESGDKQYIVIKNGENVTIYTITDRGENMYGNKDASIDVHDFVNPAVRDLRSYDVPEEAWKMCSMSENGAYDSNVSKVKKALNEVKADYENGAENAKYLEDQLGWGKLWLILSLVAILALTFVIIKKQQVINQLKK
ncbi:MAG: hypothetical protein WAW11_04320 [Patescibacteria group bacterium]